MSKRPTRRSGGAPKSIKPLFSGKTQPATRAVPVDAEFQSALQFHQQGRFSEAAESYQAILRRNPKHADALHFLGLIYYQTGNPQAALTLIGQALAIRPGYTEALNNQGITLHALQRYPEALSAYQKALRLRPAQADVLYNCGNALKEMQRYDEALSAYQSALKLHPAYIDALTNYGITLHTLQRFDEALNAYDRALRINPDRADTHINRGTALKELLRMDEALTAYDTALRLCPEHADAHYNRANLLKELRRYGEALAGYETVLRLRPGCVEALNNQGNTLHQMQRYDAALAIYEEALKLSPDNADAHYNRANTLNALKRYAEALAAYDAALQLRPDDAAIHNNRGNALKELKRSESALDAYDAALRLRPDFVEALNNRGNILHELKRYEDALIAHDASLRLRPDYADALNNRGNTLKALKRYDEALAEFKSALSVSPDLVEAHNNLSYALFELQRYDEALAACDAALRLRPDHADALNSRANIDFVLRHCKEALQGFEAVMRVQPDYEEAAGMRLHSAMHLCDWERLDDFREQVFDLLDDGKLPSAPFPLLSTDAPLHRLKQCAEGYTKERHPTEKALKQGLSPLSVSTPRKIRIAYFSADYFNHATSYLVAELLEKHDRTRFEIIGYCYWRSPDDDMRKRIIGAFDRFYSVHDLSDQEIAQHARDNAIDIAIDLKGHTQYARLGIFAHRAAPVQIHYLGYPGTLGAPFIDYLIADPVLIPPQHQEYYAEKIIYLPDSYQANDSRKIISERVFTRSELGLPEKGFVFCCFNNNYKITPDVFDIWMRLLNQVEGSVLWLLESNSGARSNLEKNAEARGVAKDRLVFAPWMGLSEHLARHRQADLFLDTFYYNAHTTASDALWASLPVLTRLGDAFAGRVAASLLHAVGLPEMVMPDAQAYEQMALQLATHPQQLQEIREKLAENRLGSPLFDTLRFTRNLERAYIQIMTL